MPSRNGGVLACLCLLALCRAVQQTPGGGAPPSAPPLGRSRPAGDSWAHKSRAYTLHEYKRSLASGDDQVPRAQQAAELEATAEALLQAGDTAAASAALEETLALDPARVRALHLMGHLAASARGNTTEAALLLQRACALQPASPAALSNLGYALEKWSDDVDGAEASPSPSPLHTNAPLLLLPPCSR
jgi:tetratricopeptide (TPR) repeat protein